MRLALVQLNTRVADIPGNLDKIRAGYQKARAAGAELAVFPEHALGGYPALDMWEEPGFIRANEAALRALARETRGAGLLVGYAAANQGRAGKPAYNAAALLADGKVAAVRHKTLLPTYDVFDESRYFEPAAENRPVRFRGRRLGVTVCEDAWAQDGPGRRRLYGADPVRGLARAGAQILLNLSSSPFTRGKTRRRERLFAAHARRQRLPFFYCNLVGGNDEMIFDGHSMAFDARGRLVGLAQGFAEDLLLVDSDAPGAPLREPFASETAELLEALTLGLRDYLGKCGFEKAFVGLSGGIDSALTGALAARALGPRAVTGVALPSPYSSEGSLRDAEALAKNLGIRFLTLPITAVYEAYRALLREPLGLQEGTVTLAEQNLQSRIRGALLMALSNAEGGIVLSTGNKSELSAGYCTLYGDMCGGLAVLADVNKATVYELARELNRERELIPRASLEKAPSAELKPHQLDQDELPPYDTVDDVLGAYLERRLTPGQIAARGHPRALVDELLRRIDRAEYKRRQAPPCLKITEKAFGVGRRMPLARGSYR